MKFAIPWAVLLALASGGEVLAQDPPKKYVLLDGVVLVEGRTAAIEPAAPTPATRPPCSCSSCACPTGKCPACPARAPAADVHVSPDGTVNELHPDGVYRPVPGQPAREPLPQPAPVTFRPPPQLVPSFQPYYAPYCPPGRT
jgi:hypothetical protein